MRSLPVPLTINRATAVVHLTRSMHALIDVECWPVIGLHQWHAHFDGGRYYAVGPQGMKMHQLLCPCPQNRFPDHANRNTLDNRRQAAERPEYGGPKWNWV
jgi:hypothetical protein